MTHCLALVCWLLAVGRGSGLIGLSSQTYSATTLLPHPSRPPPRAATDTVHTQNHSTVSQSPVFFLHINITRDLDQVGVTRPTTVTASHPSRPSATSKPGAIVPSISEDSTLGQSVSTQASTTTGDDKTIQVTKSTITPSVYDISISKENVPNVSQNSQQEFIRKKHNGPVRTIEDTYTLTHKKGRVNEIFNSTSSVKQIKNFSLLSKTVNAAINTFKSRSQTHRNTRRPAVSKTLETAVKYNKTMKMKGGTSPRKRPITMGIPASSTVLLSQKTTSTPVPTVEAYNSQESDEYYSSYGDYTDNHATGLNGSGYQEADLLPDPDAAQETEEQEAEVVLPDDSLADTDLHDHDIIDSVMYIYFGPSERDDRGAGRQVLVVGAVISLVAQGLTLVSVLRRLRTHPAESASIILLNAELALTAANLVFMFGVQATGSKTRCELVAVTLHYLHLAACAWLLVNSVFAYSSLQKTASPRRLRPWWVAAWSLPAFIVLLCVVFNRRGYETRSFCWVSVARGMLYSFMVPVAILILLNTCLAVLGMRQLSLSLKAEEGDRKAMRVSAILLPSFAVLWFIGVVALENSSSLVFPLLFVVKSAFLNWFVLACWLPADMSLWRDSEEDYDEDEDDLYEEVLKSPLLEEPAVYVCGRRDLCELQMDPICTISS